jgi:hypothetical protein
VHSRWCQAIADVSVSDATWSMTTRRRSVSEPAAVQDGRSSGSSVSGAPFSTAYTSSVSSSRSSS